MSAEPPAIIGNGAIATVEDEPEHLDVELTQLKPEGNVPDTDQRTHVVLTDERFIEYLARVPRGRQQFVAAVMLAIKGWQDEIVRLRRMDKLKPDQRGNVKILKDRTTYAMRVLSPCTKCATWDERTSTYSVKEGCEHTPATHPVKRRRTLKEWLKGTDLPPATLHEDHYRVIHKTVGIYTALPAVQIPLYRRKFERETAQALDWVWRMMRLWIGEDGKGRVEMIDALQASNGKLMPAENSRMPMIINNIPTNGAPGGWAKNR